MKFSKILFLIYLVFINLGCDVPKAKSIQPAANSDTTKVAMPTSAALPDYDSLSYLNVQTLHSGSGTKSVTFSKSMKYLYAMNLEGMSVYEYSQDKKKMIREFRFKPTPGTGWDYEKEKPIASFEEKPVESIITHHDSILWVSLHNAGGIVPIHLLSNNRSHVAQNPNDKLIYVYDSAHKKVDSFYVPLIKTGKTPKVIAATENEMNLLVSNWHSNSVSVLEVDPHQYPYAKLLQQIPVSSIPRGMVVDDKNNKTYVAIMGGASIAVVDNATWKVTGEITVAANPRHIVKDDKGLLYASFNKIARIGCIDPASGATLFSAPTATQPRSIVMSRNKKFLFVTCYSGNKMSAFKISDNAFIPIATMDCVGNPVGVDVFEDENKLEVWVCAYETGAISIYSFKKI